MFAEQRKQSGGLMLVGFCAVLMMWIATAGVMFKAYHDGGLSLPQCQLVCADRSVPAHG